MNTLSQRLFDQARAEVAAGLPEGPFMGVPFPVKDLGLHMAGTPTLSGSRMFIDHVASADSEAVTRYRAAGLVLFARTTTPELDLSAGRGEGDYYAAPPPQRSWLEETQRLPGGLRIALAPRPPSGGPVHPDCMTAVMDAARLCESLGHEIEEVRLPVDAGMMNDAFFAVLAVETRRVLEDRAAVLGRELRAQDVEPVTWMFAATAPDYSGLDFSRARAAFERITFEMDRFMRDYDVILSPTLAMPPVPLELISLSPPAVPQMIELVTRFAPYAAMCNVSGQPSMSVPLFWNEAGLPIGSMFSARYGDEATLYRLAAQLEQARSWHQRMPAV